MKTLKTGSKSVTLELTKEEIAIINYCYQTSQGKFNKKEQELFQKLDALAAHMDYLKEVETSITAIFNKK